MNAGKLTDKHFVDWEGDVFGYGYGSGERPILGIMVKFFYALENGRSYDYRTMYSILGIEQFWFLINALCNAGIIDYGTSPRWGWLTEKGEMLRDYIMTKTLDELCMLVCADINWQFPPCYRDHCNCETPCNNPLFK